VAPEQDEPKAGVTQTKMISCTPDDGRYTWHFHYNSYPYSRGWEIRMWDGSGCIKARNPGVQDDSNRVELMRHADSDIWLFDLWPDDAICMGSGCMRLKRNLALCLQQGHAG